MNKTFVKQISDPTFARAIEGNPMSRSSFASFHLTGIKPSSGKLMTSSVDRLFENDSDVFISSNYNDFNQVGWIHFDLCCLSLILCSLFEFK